MSDAIDDNRPAKKPGAHFPCAHCHAAQTFDPVHGMLRCQYCGNMREVPADPRLAEGPGERPLDEGRRAAAVPQSAASAETVLRCGQCGALVVTDSDDIAGQCAFCGAAGVVPVLAHPRALRPDSVLPFCVEKRAAAMAFARWLRRLWLRPSDLRQLAALEKLRGVYIPFWIFAAQVDSQWTAESGRHYYVEEADEYSILGPPSKRDNNEEQDDDDQDPGVQGGRQLPLPRHPRSEGARRVRKTRWRPAAGQRADVHRDILICASQGLQGALADRLATYNLRRLVPYADGYLAGFGAEAYAVDLAAGHGRARQQMDAAQLQRCAAAVEGDMHRSLIVRNRYHAETFRYALLPVWIATYRYRAKVYRFVVSGQNAEVVGQAPYSRLKVALVCLLGFFAVLLFLYLQYQKPDGL